MTVFSIAAGEALVLGRAGIPIHREQGGCELRRHQQREVPAEPDWLFGNTSLARCGCGNLDERTFIALTSNGRAGIRRDRHGELPTKLDGSCLPKIIDRRSATLFIGWNDAGADIVAPVTER